MSRKNQKNLKVIKDGEFKEVPPAEENTEQNEVERDFVERQYDKYCERKKKRAAKKAEREQKGGLSRGAKWAIGLGLAGSVALGIGKAVLNRAADELEDDGEDYGYIPQPLGDGAMNPTEESNDSDSTI